MVRREICRSKRRWGVPGGALRPLAQQLHESGAHGAHGRGGPLDVTKMADGRFGTKEICERWKASTERALGLDRRVQFDRSVLAATTSAPPTTTTLPPPRTATLLFTNSGDACAV